MKAPLSARLCALIAGLTLSGGALAQTLPATFDLRDIDGHSYIGPVHHQGSVGTCYAFGALASAESAYNRATG
ncbi:MAG TPA: C1 family peptidase, partial [Opitutaceae bacterium]|nr:C1 family peptidase [Opitutaceae bacterium]